MVMGDTSFFMNSEPVLLNTVYRFPAEIARERFNGRVQRGLNFGSGGTAVGTVRNSCTFPQEIVCPAIANAGAACYN